MCSIKYLKSAISYISYLFHHHEVLYKKKHRLCGCGCKISDMMKGETANPSGSHIRSALFFLCTLLYSDLGCLGSNPRPAWTFEISLDALIWVSLSNFSPRPNIASTSFGITEKCCQA